MNLEGRLLGNRYEIIEKIGNGGMATVYKARCHVLNRYVAVKVLRDEFTTDEEFIKRFNTEAQSAASLTHPNIVSIYDVGNEGNLYYIVMELIQGKTLKDIILQEGPLSWKWTVNIAMQIASALEVAHKNSIIHRDIKPHNIIITEDGIAKVTDFGIAKAVSNSTITAFGTTIGSVHYFSPEHARGGFTNAQSDLYSLGVVMYEMLTGKVPFDADTPVSIALKHMQERPIEPIEIDPDIPVAVNGIVMKAMQKETTLRYQNATEMMRDLSRALKNPDSDFVVIRNIQDNSPTQRIPTINDRNFNSTDEEYAEDEEERRNKKKKIAIISGSIIGLLIVSVIATFILMNVFSAKDIQVPNLEGLSLDFAKKEIENTKLTIVVKEEEYNSEVPEGAIISQTPKYKEDYKIKENTVIEVIVSLGEKITTVPKVVGLEKQEAIRKLEEAELKYEITEEYNKKIESGIVIEQDIAEKTQVNADSIVKLKVSLGTQKTTVPNLLNKTEEQAKKEITDAGLTLKTIINTEDSTKTNGVVIKQDIEPGKEVDKDTAITITINKIPEIKKGTVIVNLKSITGGYKENTTENNVNNTTGTNTITKEVELRVTVGDDVVYKQKKDKNLERIEIPIQGVGTVKIRVYIDGILTRGPEQLDLNTNNPVYTAE